MDATIMTWILDYVSRRRMDKLLSRKHTLNSATAGSLAFFHSCLSKNFAELPDEGLQGSPKVSVSLRQLWTQCHQEPGVFEDWMVSHLPRQLFVSRF